MCTYILRITKKKIRPNMYIYNCSIIASYTHFPQCFLSISNSSFPFIVARISFPNQRGKTVYYRQYDNHGIIVSSRWCDCRLLPLHMVVVCCHYTLLSFIDDADFVTFYRISLAQMYCIGEMIALTCFTAWFG